METSRRAVLNLVLPAVAAVSLSRHAQAKGDGVVPWSTGTEAPTIAVPPGATDCHHHIYDGRFPVAPGVAAKPADATATDYKKLQRRLGISRHVVVQPSAYGVDNSCILDAMKQFGRVARGIAVVNTDVTDAELKRLNAAGIRGIRFNFAPAGATTPAMIAPLARRIAGMGWHVQLNADADQIVSLADTLSALPCPLVFDHLAHPPQPAGTSHPVFILVSRLLAAGKTWVKLSAAYADTKVGPPSYADTSAVAKAYVREAPERLVWGSDWPHPSEPADRKPDDAKLLDLLADWVPNKALRHRILVQNPEKL
jgi:predicted TIM-barrel fold metal-dependent hydrolase